MGGIAIDPCYFHELNFLSLEVKCAPEFSWGESSSWDITNRGSDASLRCKNYLLLTLYSVNLMENSGHMWWAF